MQMLCHYADQMSDGFIWMHILYYVYAYIGWPYIDAYGICHYADQILDGFIWMHVLYVIIFMHTLGGLICMRISYVIIFTHT